MSRPLYIETQLDIKIADDDYNYNNCSSAYNKNQIVYMNLFIRHQGRKQINIQKTMYNK